MEGLEISEISLQNAQSFNRIDAELYKKSHQLFQKKIANMKNVKLCDECKIIKKGIFDISASCYTDYGIPFVRIANLKGMLIDTNGMANIPETEHTKNSTTALCRDDIVLSKTAIAAASIVNLDVCNVSQDIVAIKLCENAQLLSQFLVVFLNTEYGLLELQRRFTGNIQTHLNLTELKQIVIPVVSMKLQECIKDIFNSSVLKMELSKRIYSEAQQILLQTLGLENWQPEAKNSSVKKFLDVQKNGRLDSEYYQPKYQEIEEKLCENRTCRVCDCFAQNKTVSDYSKDTYKYIEIGDIDVSTGVAEYNILSTNELPANAKIAIKNGDVLVSKVRPNRGAVAIINYEFDDLISSGAFTVLQESGGMKKEVLQLLLRTEIYRDLLLKWNVGSSYPVIKDEDVMNLVIPVIDETIQCEIAQKVQESFALREESKRLLEVAKTAVEIAIEKDEATALEYLRKDNSAL